MSAGNQGTQRCVESWPQPGDVVENDKSIGQRFDVKAQFQGLAVVVKAGDSCRANKFFTASEFAYYGVDQSSCEPAGLVASERHMAGAVRQLGASAYSWPPALPSATRFDQLRGSREGQTQHYGAQHGSRTGAGSADNRDVTCQGHGTTGLP